MNIVATPRGIPDPLHQPRAAFIIRNDTCVSVQRDWMALCLHSQERKCARLRDAGVHDVVLERTRPYLQVPHLGDL